MSTAALRRVEIDTTCFEQASETMRAVFGDVTLRPDDHGRLEFRMNAVGTARLTASRWSLAGICGGTLEPDESSDATFVTGIRLGGRFRMWSPDGPLDCDRPFLYPDPTDSEVELPAAANLTVARSLVRRAARAMTRTDGFVVRFTGTAPIDPCRDVIWRNTIAYAARTLDLLADVPDSAIAQADLAEFVAGLMLQTFPNTALESRWIGRNEASAGAAVRRAVAFMDEHLDQPVTIPEIAAAAGLSRRGLYAAFERERRTSPMAYLRHARLAAAHADLVRSDPELISVHVVATRWGFPDAPNFTRLYRHAYGCTPRQTLLQ